MTPLSRRTFGTMALTALLTGCGHTGGDRPATAPSAATRGGTTDTAGTTPAAPETTGTPRPLGRSVPVRLRIPAIGVDTPLLSLGLEPDGTVQVPPITAHDRAGWYRFSPTPGQIGPSVVLGHVTVGSYGDGVFRRLDRLRTGETIVARLENGTEAQFTVTSTRTVAKAHFPTDDVYGNVNRPELRLITCGGPHDGDGYRDNVIVFAALSAAVP
ncbi:class F sortase [Streptomyces nodosus]|uniref:Class F sortase n=1 Tax=Streptomyces nodosus TaxID=40318 RepID=A0A0B5DGY7_9ACTN|nr:class F sortase [Streptomyces nodosus]AJE40435.1 peptidase C60 sortase A and B [Streptomyces nodosus]MBB4791467.1 LPXTG-site transpeptidase (sortase) family protein [Streptomyces nodosus]QEV39001.1 class F sortase [Streptomyces nodosus]